MFNKNNEVYKHLSNKNKTRKSQHTIEFKILLDSTVSETLQVDVKGPTSTFTVNLDYSEFCYEFLNDNVYITNTSLLRKNKFLDVYKGFIGVQ
jgi:hypothetical protein